MWNPVGKLRPPHRNYN